VGMVGFDGRVRHFAGVMRRDSYVVRWFGMIWEKILRGWKFARIWMGPRSVA
jgi:hypothetical protein